MKDMLNDYILNEINYLLDSLNITDLRFVKICKTNKDFETFYVIFFNYKNKKELYINFSESFLIKNNLDFIETLINLMCISVLTDDGYLNIEMKKFDNEEILNKIDNNKEIRKENKI